MTAAYYNQSPSQYSEKSKKSDYDDSSYKEILNLTALILGIISLVILITLNVTTIVKSSKTDPVITEIEKQVDLLQVQVGSLEYNVKNDISPKVGIISSSTSYTIPSQLASSTNAILSEIQRSCQPTFTVNSTQCPTVQDPSNVNTFALINRDGLTKCLRDGGSINVTQNLVFTDYPSFIPGSTKPGGCIRIPTFSLSQTIYSYSHNMIELGCKDHSKSNQYWALGRIVNSPQNTPIFENFEQWLMNDGLNRKSCSTAAGFTGAWLGCTIVSETEKQDYLSPGINRLSLAYQDIYGNRKEWIFAPEDVPVDRPYNALYFSVGSGVVVGDTVYFLLYGGLTDPMPGNVYCPNIGCSNQNQQQCNAASKVGHFGSKQVVNAILYFKDFSNKRPVLTIKTIPPSISWLGAEGRLFYNDQNQKMYIYLRSSGWNPFIEIGTLTMASEIGIMWVPYNTTGRPGGGYCTNQSRCPKDCITGVYTDAFPLTNDLKLVISVILDHQTKRVNPVIVISSDVKIQSQYSIATAEQGASYTTTTCFMYINDIWCISIVEMTPAAVGDFLPVPFVYKLEVSCPNNSIWSVIRRVGTNQIQNLRSYIQRP